MKRLASLVGRILRAIGREIAATIRFGAPRVIAAPRGRPAQVDPLAAVAAMGVLGQREEPDDSRR
jgi:hypothetical protein